MNYSLTAFFILIFTIVDSFKQPNIVLIVADDLGYNDVGYRGNNQVKTPNIDALAYNGAILDNFYTLPTCTPSRAALLTGNYAIRSGFQGTPMRPGEERHLPYNMPTLPEQLKNLGYKSHLVGKWHLGCAYKNVTPISRGFDTHYGYYNGYIDYFDHEIAEQDMIGLDFRKDFSVNHEDTGVYATDLFTNRSVKIINEHDYKDPLFLMISHIAPHTGQTIGVDQTILQERNTESMNKNFGYIQDVNRRRYVDMVQSLDESIGVVMKTLSNIGVLNSTFILFISDNGAPTFGIHQNYGSNWPLKGIKDSYYQGGIKGTAVFYSKSLDYKGKINRNLMHITDLLPTFYAAGGGNTEDLGRIDGVNQLSTLLSSKFSNRNEILVNIDEVLNKSAIITHHGRYKLIQGRSGNVDDYSGISGRLPEDGRYDVKSVLKSDTNNVLKLYRNSQLTSHDVLRNRQKSSTKNCRNPSNYNVKCDLCLFDLFLDPCETTNIEGDNRSLVKELQGRISNFSRLLIPQQNKNPDRKADPALFDGSWSYWLDRKA